MEVSSKAKAFYYKTLPLQEKLAKWIDDEEARLGREVTEDEIDVEKFKIFTAAGIEFDENGKYKEI